MNSALKTGLFVLFSMLCHSSPAQQFLFGADLSYVNEMESCGAVYLKDGAPQNVYGLFKDHGANLARFRLWHTPSWYDALNQGARFSDYEDVRLAISRAKTLGYSVLLDFHLSDTWADPAHQVVPAAWNAVVNNQTVLGDSVYQYFYQTLTSLGQEGLMPDIVQIGNETNKGILLSQAVNDQGWSLDWGRNVFLFQRAADAIAAVENNFGIPIKTAIHIADPADVSWYAEQFAANGFNAFDIIGISYYWQYHQPVTLAQLGQIIAGLKADHPGKEVMIFETAYGWTTQNADNANNLLFNAHPSYSPLSPANQLKWMTDLTQTVIDHGGSGVVYWEPAWVSTDCETQWVTGSSWDNATFFDHDLNVMEEGGFGWMSHAYDFTSSTNSILRTSSGMDLLYADGVIIIKRKDGSLWKGPVSFALYSMDGIRVFSEQLSNVDDSIIQIAVPPLVAGSYLVSVADKDFGRSTGLISVMSK